MKPGSHFIRLVFIAKIARCLKDLHGLGYLLRNQARPIIDNQEETPRRLAWLRSR